MDKPLDEAAQSEKIAFESAKEKVVEITELYLDTTLGRKQRERLRNFQDIMRAATELFCENGFGQVTMQEIAAKAEFATGTLYKYFGSKQELFVAIVLDRAFVIGQEINKLLDLNLEPEAMLRAFIRGYRGVFRSHARFVLLFHSVANSLGVSDNRYLDDEVDEIVKQCRKRLATIIEQGVESGVFRSVDTSYASVMLSTLLDNMTLAVIHEGVPHDDDLNTIEDVFLSGLLIKNR